jgi:hypothetical protein
VKDSKVDKTLKILLVPASLFAVFMGLLAFSSPPYAQAADLSKFKAGNIMSDSVMTNKSSMNVSQIQSFLNSKVSCDTNGTRPASEYGRSDLTHAQYAALRGWHGPPYNCLNIFTEGGRSAAQIIYDAAQQYGINPQSLIVLLQKEQGLVTDTWPLNSQYRGATGYGCPDTAPCDAEYYGFTNQVNMAARHFSYIIKGTWGSGYHVGNNSILYNPNYACGSSNVYVENRTTQALYLYTPYQPNAAALASGYGQGDGCSAHGNRNFFAYFTDWFGPTTGPDYHATWVSQSAYPTLNPAEGTTWYITYKNTGRVSWYDNTNTPVRMATYNPINHPSLFADDWGPDNNRPGRTFDKVYKADGSAYATTPHEVKSGESVRFAVKIKIPENHPKGEYYEYLRIIQEASDEPLIATSHNNVWATINVREANVATFQSQSNYPTVKQGSSSEAYFTFKNTGNIAWHDSESAQPGIKPVVLAATSPINRNSAFNSQFISSSRPAIKFDKVYKADGKTLADNQHVAQPGEIVKFSFKFTAPQSTAAGTYREYFQPILEGGNPWDMGGMVWLDVKVEKN